jgi:HEPN superfamily AbiU2-like protein
MTTRTADEIRTNYIEKMGEPLGTQFAALLQEVARLQMAWGEFIELFGDEPRVNVLNRAAPAMFHIIGHALWQLTLLDIARLTDPPKSAGKKNLTIQNLPELVKPEVRADV